MSDKLPWVMDAETIRLLLGGLAGGVALALVEKRDWVSIARFGLVGGLTAFYTAAALAPSVMNVFHSDPSFGTGVIGFTAFVMGIGAPSFVEMVISAFRLRRERMEKGKDDV